MMAAKHLQARDGSIWSRWQKPVAADVRGPCPALNALANHGILPSSGVNIPKDTLIRALGQLSLKDDVANGLYGAIVQNGLAHANGSFDLPTLGTHNKIEHDGSLSRIDAALGNQIPLNQGAYDDFIGQFDDLDTVDEGAAGKARYFRIQQSEKDDSDFTYGVKQQLTSLAETAAYMGVLGGPSDPQVKTEWIKVLFEEERFPYTEGWRPSEDQIGITNLLSLMGGIAKDSGEVFNDIGSLNWKGLFLAMQDLTPGHWPVPSLFNIGS